MKKTFLLFLLIIMMIPLYTMVAFSVDECNIEYEFFEDGSYAVIVIQKETPLLAKSGSVTETKTYKYYDNNHSLDWTASITASFTYNGVMASCTSVSKSTTIYDTSWKCTASSCSKSGATATGSFTFKYYLLGVPVKTINKTLTLTCDPNGNIT